MKKWFDDLRQVNDGLLRAARKARAEQWLRRSAVEKYAEPTHFIFELLQNADDQEAKRVRFKLFPDRAEFYHWGKPFRRDDVERITRLGDSGKPDEIHKIGSFGIGFKSVFAVTDRPEVYCTLEGVPFAFAINDLIVPIELPRPPDQGEETLFVLPYTSKAGTNRSAEAGAQLAKAGPEVLMFLNHIEDLTWEDTTGGGERYRCVRDRDGVVLFKREALASGKDKQRSSAYRIFRKDVQLPDGKPSEACLAFRLDDDGKAVGENSPVKLWVYFETEEQTGFRFRLHGPFKLTDSRANIMRGEPFNRELISELSALAASALVQLRDEGRLARDTLNALPVPSDNFPEDWKILAETIWRVMSEQEVLPKAASGYAASASLWQGTQELRAVLADADLAALAEKNMAWTVSMGQRNGRVDQLLKHVGVVELTLNDLPKQLHELASRTGVMEAWLTSHDDQWFQRFYRLLNGIKSHQAASLSRLPIVRTADGNHRRASDARFTPANDGKDSGIRVQGVSFVAPALLTGEKQVREEVEDFLEQLGVKLVDESDYIHALLTRYYVAGSRVSDMKAHVRHIERFAAWLATNSDKAMIFQRANLFLLDDSDALQPPSVFYIDRPFLETGLNAVFGMEGPLKDRKRPFAKRYRGVKGVVEFACALGVMQNLIPTRTTTDNHPEKRALRADYNSYRSRWGNATDVDWVIPDLGRLLAEPSVAVSLCIWRSLQALERTRFVAKFRHAESYPVREKPASFVYLLKSEAWIPSSSGEFRKPEDIVESELPPEFDATDRTGWLDLIGLGTGVRRKADEYQEKRQAAIRAGIPDDFAEQFQELSEDQKRCVIEAGLRQLETIESAKPEFPERDSANPDRRRVKAAEVAEGAPEKRREVRERTVRVEPPGHRESTRVYLADLYTNDDGVMVCQCCRNGMPFQLADGSYYFEAVQFDYECERELTQNYMALCPVCAAKYRNARTTTDAEMRAGLESGDSEIPVTLAGKPESIRFVNIHKDDLLNALGVAIRCQEQCK